LAWLVDVDSVPSVDVFKKRSGQFWFNQPVRFDWIASLTGTGDRSETSSDVYLSIGIRDADRVTTGPRGTVVPASVTSRCLLLSCLTLRYAYDVIQ